MTTYLMYFHLSVSTIKFCLGTFTFEWFSQTYKQRDLCAKLIKNAKIYTLDTMPRRNAIVHDCSCVFFVVVAVRNHQNLCRIFLYARISLIGVLVFWFFTFDFHCISHFDSLFSLSNSLCTRTVFFPLFLSVKQTPYLLFTYPFIVLDLG